MRRSKPAGGMFTVRDLKLRIKHYSDPRNRMLAHQCGIWSDLKRDMRDACRAHKIQVPWWAEK
ncbi:MAG: hypothetical protein K6T99_10495 [Armatimonadetes bacterium]|nr:hypothetical protein [Armatimonadota bacterium]